MSAPPYSFTHFRQLAGSGLRALLPASCAVCGCSAEERLCEPCRQRYLESQPARCRCCARAIGPVDSQCGHCLQAPPAFDATVAATDYAAPLDQLVLSLKFGGRLDLAPLLARLMRDALLDRGEQGERLPDLLVPVPLAPERLAQRGFNQAQEIARLLSRSLGIELQARLLVRVRETQAQSLLHPEQRRENVHGAFALDPALMHLVAARHVGVVDDVMTTGETLTAVAAVLKRFGAARVTNLVFARTPAA